MFGAATASAVSCTSTTELWHECEHGFDTLHAALLLVLIPVAVAIPALAALALVSGVCSLAVAYEAIRYRESRTRVRHPAPVA
jgi:hypothetical protein